MAQASPAPVAAGRPVALVTGSSGAIGRACAVLLSRRGHDVAVHYSTNADGAAETAALVEAEGGRAELFQADLRASGAAAGLVADVVERTGRLDVVVNSAGVLWQGRPGELPEATFEALARVNVWAPYTLIVAAGRHLPRGGRIVNVSSDAARFPRARVAAYAATKAALESLTRSFAEALGPAGVTVNAVAPGPTRTPMLEPMMADEQVAAEFAGASVFGRLAEPEDIASVVAFLAGPDGGWITGQVLDATGGRRA